MTCDDLIRFNQAYSVLDTQNRCEMLGGPEYRQVLSRWVLLTKKQRSRQLDEIQTYILEQVGTPANLID